VEKQVQRAVERVLNGPSFGRRAHELRDELARYQPLEIIDEYLAREVKPRPPQGMATSR
jgi:hypothetical protein